MRTIGVGLAATNAAGKGWEAVAAAVTTACDMCRFDERYRILDRLEAAQ